MQSQLHPQNIYLPISVHQPGPYLCYGKNKPIKKFEIVRNMLGLKENTFMFLFFSTDALLGS